MCKKSDVLSACIPIASGQSWLTLINNTNENVCGCAFEYKSVKNTIIKNRAFIFELLFAILEWVNGNKCHMYYKD